MHLLFVISALFVHSAATSLTVMPYLRLSPPELVFIAYSFCTSRIMRCLVMYRMCLVASLKVFSGISNLVPSSCSRYWTASI